MTDTPAHKPYDDTSTRMQGGRMEKNRRGETVETDLLLQKNQTCKVLDRSKTILAVDRSLGPAGGERQRLVHPIRQQVQRRYREVKDPGLHQGGGGAMNHPSERCLVPSQIGC